MCGGGGGSGREGSGWWGQVDVNKELKFLGKFTKKKSVGCRVGGGGGGVMVDVNAMLGVGGDVGYGRCEPRIEGIIQCTKMYCTILRKFKKWGGGEGAIFEPKRLSMYLKKKKKKKVKKEKN